MKRVRLETEKEGFPVTTIREISILKKMKHLNIVHLLDVVVSRDRDSIFLVFEYVEHDLATLIDRGKVSFSQSEIKQLLLVGIFLNNN